MTGVRNTWFVVSLALLASLVGNIAIHRHFERSVQPKIHVEPGDASSFNDLRLQTGLSKSEIARLEMPRFLDDTRPRGTIVPANDRQEEDHRAKSRRAESPPTAVPAPTDAVPVENSFNDESLVDDAELSAVRDVIEHELSHATREERDIWFEELKSLPAGVVADLLQVRKQLHALPKLLGGMPEKLASADPNISHRIQEITAEPASQKIRFNFPDYQTSGVSLEAAIAQLRHNLANSATAGFKRLRVTIVDAYSSQWSESGNTDGTQPDASMSLSAHGEGCRMAPILLDLKQGTLKKTGRQLDLAIDGEGFFVVRRGDRDFLTRCGTFTFDRDRQLCLVISSTENAVLQPSIKIPDNAREIQIAADGMVTILKSGEETVSSVGQLQLARVASPTRLQPTGNTLYLPNAESGEIVPGTPMSNGIGELQQGFIEQSNVDFEQELAEIEEFSLILKQLPVQSFRPVTARSQQNAPSPR